MQLLTKKELGNYPNEFEAAKAAQDGNSAAWMLLWNHYRPLLVAQIRHAKGIAKEDLESEAIILFAHKLELFNRNKVSKPEGYSMHSWLYLGAINLNNKLIRQRKREVHLYNERVSSCHTNVGGGGVMETNCSDPIEADDYAESDSASFQKAVNPDIFNYYNPERLVIGSLHEDDTERVKAFYTKLTDFERGILECRREKLTIAEIADKFKCHITTVKLHLKKAKKIASAEFEVAYA